MTDKKDSEFLRELQMLVQTLSDKIDIVIEELKRQNTYGGVE